MAAALRSTDLRDVVAPLLNTVFDGVYDQRTDEWKDIFKQETGIQRAYEEEVLLYGTPLAQEVPEGMPVPYAQGGENFNYRYNFKVYGQAFALTRVLVEDGQHIQVGKVFSKHLAQALIETKEVLAANILNRGFNGAFTYGDGQALLGNAHPVQAGTQSNILPIAAALSQTSVEQLTAQIAAASDFTGKRINLKMKSLVVSPQNWMQAKVILNSVLRTGTANNDINPINGELSNMVKLTRLSSPTAWFITTDGAIEGLKLKMRRPLEKTMEGDFETDSMRYKATERYAFGVTDWRGIYGTVGA